jgi:hypothetical protein
MVVLVVGALRCTGRNSLVYSSQIASVALKSAETSAVVRRAAERTHDPEFTLFAAVINAGVVRDHQAAAIKLCRHCNRHPSLLLSGNAAYAPAGFQDGRSRRGKGVRLKLSAIEQVVNRAVAADGGRANPLGSPTRDLRSPSSS